MSCFRAVRGCVRSSSADTRIRLSHRCRRHVGSYFALQRHAIHFGYELAFGDYGIVIGVYLVDDAADLRTDFHFRHRFDGAGGGYRFRYLAFGDGCLVGHFMLALEPPKSRKPAPTTATTITAIG